VRGVPSGPYLVMPILGPNTLRDVTGWAVDMMFRPTTYLLTPGGAFFFSGFLEPSGQFSFLKHRDEEQSQGAPEKHKA